MKVNMRRKYSESGLVSFVVCMILMIILALITISFAAISRREQRQALDKQLSSQAFYAAETGVNDALAAINDPVTPLVGNVTSCDNTEQDKISTNRTLSGDVAYTCVFVDQTPPQIVDTVKEDSSSVFKISAPGISRMTFEWENDDKTQAQTFPMSYAAGAGNFTPYAAWDGGAGPGILRIQLIPIAASRAASANTIDAYGFPTTNNSRPSHAASDTANNGDILTGGCDTTTDKCRVELTGLSGDYYLRMIAIYDAVSVTVEGFDGGGSPVLFNGAQAAIDSTGKSSDVLRRIKVHKSLLNDKSGVPDFTLAIGDDLCKRLSSNSYLTSTDTPAIPLCVPTGIL